MQGIGPRQGEIHMWTAPRGVKLCHDLQAFLGRLQQQTRELEGVRAADKARVRDVAKAALARQRPEGQKIRVSDKMVKAIASSPCGDMFATVAHNVVYAYGSAAVGDAADGTCVHQRHGNGNSLLSVAWSPDGSRMATGSIDHAAAVWDASAGTYMHELHGHNSLILSVAWSPDGCLPFTASCNSVVHICSLAC